MENLFENLIKIVAGDVGSLITTIIIGAFTIVSGLIFNKLKKWFNINVVAKYKNRKILDNIDNTEIINNLLIELRVRTDSDRCMIFQFHNGTEFLNENLHTLSFTCLHEATEPGFVRLREGFQNTKISQYYELISTIVKNDLLIYDNETRKNYEPFTYLSFKYGIYSFVGKMLTEKNGGIVGFLLLTWNSEIIISEEQKEYIKQFSNNIKYNF